MLRDAALVAGTGLDELIRARAARPTPRPILIGAGLVATGAAWVLVHVAGADPRVWIAPGQSGLVTSLLETFSNENTPAETP